MNLEDDRRTIRPEPGPARRELEDPGPRRPDVDRPGPSDELLRRMRRVDPDQAKRYRQRSGQ